MGDIFERSKHLFSTLTLRTDLMPPNFEQVQSFGNSKPQQCVTKKSVSAKGATVVATVDVIACYADLRLR